MISEKPWKPEAVVLLVAWVLVTLFAGAVVGFALDRFLPDLPEEQRKFCSFISGVVGFHGAALVLVTLFLHQHQVRWREFLGLSRRQVKRGLPLAIGAGVLVVPLAVWLNELSREIIQWLGMTPEQQPTIKVLQVSVSVGQRICFAVAAILVAPVAEESLFRGILYPAIKQHGYPRAALYGTSLLFGAIHANLMTLLPLALFAVVLVFLYESTDTLVAPIVTHALFNAVNFFLYVYGNEITDWWHRLV